MTKKNEVKTPTPEEVRAVAINEVLENSKDKGFEGVLVLGIQKDGTIAFNTNFPQYQWLQWLLNRASFELNVHEKSANASRVEQEQAEITKSA